MDGAPRNLVLIRHGESEANAANIFTGRSAAPLTETGRRQMRELGERLMGMGLAPMRCYASSLERTRESAAILTAIAQAAKAPIVSLSALDERDYGDLTGMNKAAAAARWGEAQVKEWRRSYTAVPPGGESLRDTAARVLACYIHTILPEAMAGGTTIVVAHGNSLRALVMALDDIPHEAVPTLQIASGEALVYRLDRNARAVRAPLILKPGEATWLTQDE